MRVKRLIKRFQFEERNRSRITLGTDVRLNPETHRLQLKETSAGTYPTTADLYAKTWVTTPERVRQWLSFEAEIVHPKDDLGQPLTSAGYRLSDGTDEYWWDGGAWTVNTTDWNTEQEVAANISDFPATAKQLQVIINLVTTDETVTPELAAVKVLYSADIEHQEDYVYRSLVRLLRSEVRPISDYPIKLTAVTDVVDIDDYPLETPYNVVGVDSVFDHTADPNHFTDLLASYDAPTKVITLTSAVAAGNILWVKFIWEPEVAVTTAAEYTEVAKVPAIEISDINLVDSADTGTDDWVIDKGAGTAVKVFAPLQADIEFTLRGLTDSARDQHRLADELKRFFRNNPIIRSVGMDEEFRLWLLTEYDMATVANRDEIQSGRLRARIVKALFYERDAVDVYAVQRFNLTGDMNAVINQVNVGD